MTTRMPWWWWLALLPAVSRGLVDLAWDTASLATFSLAAVPGLALVGVAFACHASSRPLAVQLRKELALLGPLAVTGLGGGGAAFAVMRWGDLSRSALGTAAERAALDQQVKVGLVAGALGMILVGAGAFFAAFRLTAAERDLGTATRWLLAPSRRPRLLALKYLALVLVFGLLLAETALSVWVADSMWLLVVFVGLSATLAPYFGLLKGQREPPAWVLLAATVTVGLAALVHDGLFVPALFFWGGVCVVASFRLVRHVDPLSSVDLTAEWAAGLPFRVRLPRSSAGLHLFAKELRLQRGAAVLGATMAMAWGVWAVLDLALPQPGGHVWTPVGAILGLFWTLSVGASLLAGATAFAEERTLGTLAWQEALVPRRTLFAAKAWTAFLTVLAVSVALPLALLAVAPGWDAVAKEFTVVSADVASPHRAGPLLAWGCAQLGAAGLGLLASVMQKETSRAFLMALGLAAAGALLVGLGLELVWTFDAPYSSFPGYEVWCAQGPRVESERQRALLFGLADGLQVLPLAFLGLAGLVVGRAAWLRRKPGLAWALSGSLVAIGALGCGVASDRVNDVAARSAMCASSAGGH